MLNTAAPARRLDVNLKISVPRLITIAEKGCAARSSRWCCPKPRPRASGGSLARRRRGCCGPLGVIARCRRANRRAGARGNILRGSSCLHFTPGRAPVPSAARRCNRLSGADGSTLRAACSIAGRKASARRKSESRQSPCRRSCTVICALEASRAAVRRRMAWRAGVIDQEGIPRRGRGCWAGR